jgi:hypothetical protein
MRGRPGRPPKDTKNTEHILVSNEVKEGLEFLRKVHRKESYGEVVAQLYHRYLFTFRCMFFMTEAAKIIQKEGETNNQAFERLLHYKPTKLELENDPTWINDHVLMKNDLESFIQEGIALDTNVKHYLQTQ